MSSPRPLQRTRRTRSTGLAAAAGLLAALALSASGCSLRGSLSGEGDPTSSPSPTRPATASATASAPPAASSAPAASTTTSAPAAAPAPGAPGTTAPATSAAPPPRPSTTAPAAPTGSAGSTPTAVDRCHTSQLTGSSGPVDAGAGQRNGSIVLRNTSRTTCSIKGYGGISLVAGSSVLPTRQERDTSRPAARVVLAPGASVTSTLHWTAVAAQDEPQSGACEPTATVLRVIPPDETDALSFPWGGGPVCQHGSIGQLPYAAS